MSCGAIEVRLQPPHEGEHLIASSARWQIAAATLIGAILCTHALTSTALGFDEGATLYFAGLPLGELWGAAARLEVNPPLFFSLEHIAVGWLGSSATILRGVAAFAAILCVPVAGIIGQSLGGRNAAIAAAALVATSPVQLAVAQEARGYAALSLCGLLIVAAALHLWRAYAAQSTRSTLPPWITYGVASIAALYVHDTAVLMVAAISLASAVIWLGPLGRQRRFLLHWCAAMLAIAACYAPFVPIVLHQAVHTLAHFWMSVPDLNGLRYGMMNSFGQPHVHTAQPFVDIVFVATAMAALILHRSDDRLPILAGGILLGVPLATWVISQWRPIMNGQSLEWLAPVFLCLVALGATTSRKTAFPVTALLILVQLYGCVAYYRSRSDEGFAAIAADLAHNARAGDVVYLDAASDLVLLQLFGWARNDVRVYAASDDDPWYRANTFRPLPIESAATLDQTRRLWLLTRSQDTEHRKISDEIAARLGVHMRLAQREGFGTGHLRTMELSLFTAR